ncbi:probable 2-oxoglutarate-dependent dioxygenase AOP1 [Impatiens glandulifera]|uniref:probable 2-oxoglutarate-dependent dioxygenase AOP1 n=1 Tax=Impatiens glandulifera TaxID=253017 RepID=UPI001FB0B605|nr:probable 2-oxoglutarate-dependent dioxygenase AOP1 [Impatiens glandulifera]
MDSFTNNQVIPVIDFSIENLQPDSETWMLTSKKILRALEEFGCFVANYTKVSTYLREAMFKASKDLFELPIEIKMKNISKTPYIGYVGQLPFIPLFEGLGIEDATTVKGVQSFTSTMWPSGNQFFFLRSETSLMFSRIVAELHYKVVRMVGENYGVEKECQTLIASTSYHLRLLNYKLPERDDQTNVGFIPHTDTTFMTILHQNHVKGLEIKIKDSEEWVFVDSSPSSFVVIAGDALMAWTNGRIKSAYHRVIMRGKEERFSVGLFTFIKDILVKAPEKMVDEEHPLLFKPFDNYKLMEYLITDEAKNSNCPFNSFCGLYPSLNKK